MRKERVVKEGELGILTAIEEGKGWVRSEAVKVNILRTAKECQEC